MDPSFVTQCEIQVGHRYTVHVCARSGSEFLDPSTVTQYEVQVGHRYTVHVCARLGVPCLIGSECGTELGSNNSEPERAKRASAHLSEYTYALCNDECL